MEQLQVYEEHVARTDVARAYLAVELENTLGHDLKSDTGTLAESLTQLTDKQINRLLEAMSYSYRMNGVFHTVTDRSYDWQDVEIPISHVRLTAMNPALNEVIFSDEVARDPTRLAQYLNRYFTENPHADPDGLGELRPRDKKVPKSNVIVVEKGDGIDVIDGNHRIIMAAMLGAASVRAYRGILNEKDSQGMIGDSVFLTLRLRYESAETDADREMIMGTCELLARTSIDGESAIQTYWIGHARRESTASAGAAMITRLQQPPHNAGNL